MCGFGGVISSSKQVTVAEASAIASSVSFRGPDSCGLRILDDQLNNAAEGPHALFFNRLAIMDIDARSDQPFENERYLLTFNGEIYNYQPLKRELEQKGVVFKTTSDTEVLFHSLIEWGTAALPKLNGMFAFFWLDKQTRRFTIARDRLGIKPLYYRSSGKTFQFGSELHSIMRLSSTDLPVSADAVNMYLWLQFVPTPYAAIESIFKLPPGHYMQGMVDHETSPEIHAYWDAYEYVNTKHHQPQKDLETILRDSLDRQLHADVPLGLFLSSGVDSSLLAALVNKYYASEQDVNFFTVKFDQATSSDESGDAQQFIKQFNNSRLHCNTISINSSIVKDHLHDMYDYFDEPFGDHASLLNWMISKKAREHVTVAISGDGADELFWGYNRYQRWQKFGRISNAPLLPALGRSAAAMINGKLGHNLRFVLEQDPVKRHFNFFLASGMRFKINDHITRYPMWSMQGVKSIKSRNDLPAVLDIKTYLADAMLYKVDRSSMASSLEVRVPYLDNEVLNYALAMPLSQKSTQAYISKAPLKELLTKLAPHYQVDRPKKGFNFPLRSWLKGEWKEQVLSTVNKHDLESAGLNAAPYVKLVHDFYEGRNDYFTDVWYIFNLALWMNKIKKVRHI